MKEKKRIQKPEMEFIQFNTTDVITTSGGPMGVGGDTTPDYGGVTGLGGIGGMTIGGDTGGGYGGITDFGGLGNK